MPARSRRSLLAPVAATAPYAVLVGGETPADALAALAGQMQAAGFAEVAVLTGPPPALEQAAAAIRGMTTRGELGRALSTSFFRGGAERALFQRRATGRCGR